MTTSSKRFVRPLALAAAFAASFAVLAGGTDHGALLGIGAANAADRSSGGHGGMGSHGGIGGGRAIGSSVPRNGRGARGGAATTHHVSRGAPRNVSANSEPATLNDPHIAHGVDSGRH
jgi:hypothetical protein